MKKRLIITALVLAAATSAWACRTYTTQTWINGKLITCMCTDCGYGANCNCF